MLQSLHVKNLALIDEIEVEFAEGLNILTGETGAGKSIILGSVNLALGGRYTKDLIRQGENYALVELVFTVTEKSRLKALEKLCIYPEDGLLILSRKLMDGRSVSRINGETVTIAVLKEVAAILIDIHGQHEHQSLLYKKNHLGFVDAFAWDYLADIKKQAASAYQEYRTCKKTLDEADMDESSRAKELDFLKFEVSEIEDAMLKEGEDEELETTFKRMENGRKIAESTAASYAYTSGEAGSASECLSRAIRELAPVSNLDETAGNLYSQLMEIDSLLNDFNHDLSDYQDSLEFSEEDYVTITERLNEINRLKTKYGTDIAGILDYGMKQQQKIQKLEDYENYIADLKRDLEQKEQKLEKVTKKLTKIRKEQAQIMEQAITEGLADLNFEDVKFSIAFEKAGSYSANGSDDVEFMISLNPGQPVRPLVEVASGGELSRIMLVIKSVMADRDEIPTLIFDEIDVGISGRTAQKVSEKMALIGRKHQVICITHLAQIAAMADHHFMIEKNVSDGQTKTSIRELKAEESTDELARILGGAKITDTVRQNAKEMQELAAQIKK